MTRELLDKVRIRIGLPPRRRGLFSNNEPPSWMKSKDDGLMEFYRKQELIFCQGTVVWGVTVQAHEHLFGHCPSDHAAQVVYSLDPSFEQNGVPLQWIAQHLYSLKETTPEDPEERRIANLITDEMERGMGLPVPKSLTQGKEVLTSTIIVIRNHLPGRFLQNNWFPLLVHPQTPAVMIVPRLYWAPEMLALWSEQ